MLHHEILSDDGIVLLWPDGPLTKLDFDLLTRDVDDYLEKAGKLRGVLIVAHRFPGWENFAALLSHLRFIRDHHRCIERVAAVSDAAFAKYAPAIAKHFVKAEVRRFDVADHDVALAWVKGSPGARVETSQEPLPK